MVSFILTICDGDVGGCSNALKEGGWRSSFSDSILEVWFDFIRKCGYICEVSDAIILAIGDGQGSAYFSITHGCDRDHEISCARFHEFREFRVNLSVSEDGLT